MKEKMLALLLKGGNFNVTEQGCSTSAVNLEVLGIKNYEIGILTPLILKYSVLCLINNSNNYIALPHCARHFSIKKCLYHLKKFLFLLYRVYLKW